MSGNVSQPTAHSKECEVNQLEAQIAEWREFIGRGRAIDEPDAEELENHLRDQVADLLDAGLSDEEAFLVAVKRMGSIDTVSREFAREHSERLWKQFVIGTDPKRNGHSFLTEAIFFTVLAGMAVHVPRLFGLMPGNPESQLFYPRNASLLVLPFLAYYLGRRHQVGRQIGLAIAAFFAVAALLINIYPWTDDSATEALVVIHLPVAMWFVVAVAYAGDEWQSHQRRMDFVRLTGEALIYYVLIALGGGVLAALALLILEPLGPEAVEEGVQWVVMSGAAGAIVVAAWLAEAKQSVVENMAPVLTRIFTPLFALMLAGSAVAYAVSGLGREFDRDLLAVFDVLMVVVLGLVIYGISAADPTRPAGLMDRVQLVAVVSAVVLDLMVLGSMIARVADFGFTANRIAALGLNLTLLINLGWTARLSFDYLRGRTTLHPVETWQMDYLPVFGIWSAAVVVVLPLLFAFR